MKPIWDKEYDGPIAAQTQFPIKKAAQDDYEVDFQEIITLRKGAIDVNFRSV